MLNIIFQWFLNNNLKLKLKYILFVFLNDYFRKVWHNVSQEWVHPHIYVSRGWSGIVRCFVMFVFKFFVFIVVIIIIIIIIIPCFYYCDFISRMTISLPFV